MWPSYVINLRENHRRMEIAAATLSRQGVTFERVEAVNGWRLTDGEVEQVYDAASNRRCARRPLLLAEIGCYLSHVETWRRIASGSSPGGNVFEDDLEARDGIASVLDLLARDETGDWDMVKLFAFDPSPRIVHRRPLDPQHDLAVPYRVPNCMIGYVITREAAARLAERALPFFRAVDEDQKFFWETGCRVRLVLPTPVTVGAEDTVTGTVSEAREERRQSEPLSSRVRAGLVGLRYAFDYRARLAWHRWRGTG